MLIRKNQWDDRGQGWDHTGSSGIGRATAERFSAEGASLVIADIDGEAEKTAAKICEARQRRRPGMRRLRRGILRGHRETRPDEFGKLNIPMNNAAYFIGKVTVEDVDIAEWRRAIDVNLTGPMLASKFAIPAMRDAGGGSIIHVASQLGSVANQCGATIAPSKAVSFSSPVAWRPTMSATTSG